MKQILMSGLYLLLSPIVFAAPMETYEVVLAFKNSQIAIHAQFQKPPAAMEQNAILLSVEDVQSQTFIDLTDKISVILWMPSMGHGSAPTQIQRVVDENGSVVVGKYLVTNVHFIMGGLWEIRVQLKDAQGKTEMKSFDVQLEDMHGGRHI